MSVHKKASLAVFIFILAGLSVLLILRFRGAPSSKIKEVKPDGENLIMKENLELKNKYAKLDKDYAAVIADRDNVLFQAKFLLSQKDKIKEAEASFEKMKKAGEAAEKEKKEAQDRSLELQNEIQGLEEKIEKLIGEKGRAINEKKQLEELIARERDKGPILKLEDEKVRLQKELASANASIKQAQSDLKQSQAQVNRLNSEVSRSKQELSKFKEQAGESRQKIESLNKDYAQAINKNRILEEKVVQTPKKFAEIARQNKALIKQASNMHYNLGVFYTKNKEYSRAVAEFEEAVKLRPDDAYSHFNLGYIYAEYLVNRPKAIEHFRHYLRVARKEDKDMDWVKKYIITWQAWGGKEPME
ncbi:MAG: tetratricopeptide repeat protein [Candidatus Omnitrophota bacterium]